MAHFGGEGHFGIVTDLSIFQMNKTPAESPGSGRVLFTLPDGEKYVSGLLEVFLDGLKQIKDVDYTETSETTFTFTNGPDNNEMIRINYIRK